MITFIHVGDMKTKSKQYIKNFKICSENLVITSKNIVFIYLAVIE